MKRIIHGQTYNTETAIEVFSERASEPSKAWRTLYRNRRAVFFKIIVGHDGETTTLTPVSDADARALLEKCANHLVQRYFGGPAAERHLTIRMPVKLAEHMEIAATAKGLSLHSYALRCFEDCLARDGRLAGAAKRSEP
jgi:hypothetical protein